MTLAREPSFFLVTCVMILISTICAEPLNSVHVRRPTFRSTEAFTPVMSMPGACNTERNDRNQTTGQSDR